MKRHLLLLALLPTLASAQQAWNENIVTATPPTTCTSGQPIANCPVTEFRFYRSATTDGGYARIGADAAPQFRHLNVAAGQNCYYVTAFSVTHGESGPSNTFCKTNVAPPPPAGPPSPPTNGRFVTLAVVNAGAPAFSILGQTPTFRVGEFYGVIPAGRPCGDYLVTFRGQRLHRVIPVAGETWGDYGSRPLAAPCGAGA